MPDGAVSPTRTASNPAAAFAQLQSRLRRMASVDDPARAAERTVLAIPSIDFDQALLDRYAADLPALEERALYWLLALRRARVRVVVVTSLPVADEIVAYYLRLAPETADPRSRVDLLSPDDASPRPLAVKVLERPDLLAALRELVADRRAFISPFNVRRCERDLALALDVPIYGVDDRFAGYGTKTGARRVFERAGVSHPAGASGVRRRADVADALRSLRCTRPDLDAAVIKQDDAFSGDGNRIVELRGLPPTGTEAEATALDGRVSDLGPAYLEELTHGGVVEQLIGGTVRSPSVQMRILPCGEPVLLSTHDQVLGGDLGQTFVACSFPAAPAYAAVIAREARKAGGYLSSRGLMGRFGIDFVVARHDGGWHPYAVEINLREGGTSHPYETLWLLTGGSLDQTSATFRTPIGQVKHYVATDRLWHPDYRKIGLEDCLAAATAAGLDWDPGSQTGAVFHMLRSLQERGRIGVTAIGNTPDQAREIYVGVANLLDRLAAEPAAAAVGL
jgi:pheganomycin biosynthesis PGM1-like protein